jgi:hypothetical protein
MAAHPDFLWKFQRRQKSPQPFGQTPAHPGFLPPRVKQPRPPPATGRSTAALVTSGHWLASRTPPLHLKWRCRPILSPPLPFPLPPLPPPLKTGPSIAAGRAPTPTASAPSPRPYIKAPLTPPLITAPCATLCSTPSCLPVPLLRALHAATI